MPFDRPSLQRELGALSRSGLLELRQDGRRTYYRANAGSSVFSELRELFGKTAGIIATLQRHRIDRSFVPRRTMGLAPGSLALKSHSHAKVLSLGFRITARKHAKR